ncbi:hypothetical protein TNCV_4497841 [Trichonephila clavipes]|nr:hypothetical protein TNCV_4497841 [Trichonephila clavipes]
MSQSSMCFTPPQQTSVVGFRNQRLMEVLWFHQLVKDKNDTHRLSLDFYDQPAGSDLCTWPWGHCLLSELREWRQQTGRHNGLKEFGAPLTMGEAYLKIIMSSFLGFCEWNTRNRWRDGQVCPDVDKELWRLGPDGSGVFWRWTSVSRCGQGTMAPWTRRLGCVFGVLCANKKEEVKRDFGDLRIRRSEGRVVNTPLVFKRVLLERKEKKR